MFMKQAYFTYQYYGNVYSNLNVIFKILLMNNCYLFLSLTFLVLACRKDNSLTNFKDDTSITNPYGSWKLLSKEDYSTNAVIYKDQEVNSYCSNRTPCDVILNFNRINTTDSITGHTITNEISGSFSYDG